MIPAFSKVCKWLRNNKLSLNTVKTEFIIQDKFQTLQNKAARTIAKLQYDEANHDELLTEFGWFSVRNLISLDTAIFVYKKLRPFEPAPWSLRQNRSNSVTSTRKSRFWWKIFKIHN